MYEIGPRRAVRIRYLFSPVAFATVVKDEGERFIDVREWYYDQWMEYMADRNMCTVIPVIRAHVTSKARWIWHASVPGLLSDGPAEPDYATKTEALMAGLEKYPDGIVDDRKRS